jgi:hypothetical protein
LNPPVSHQTIKLMKGRHAAPVQGACVMELASMLAGEPFSDHPKSVSPVIGSLLRAYNDSIDDDRRQDLYAYAAKVVGSNASEDIEEDRVIRLAAWRRELLGRRFPRRLLPRFIPELSGERTREFVGGRAVRAIKRHTAETHAEVLSLIDELLAIGGDELRDAPAWPPLSRPDRLAPASRH